MQRHADEGARIIDRLGFLDDAVPAIRHHHERFDGTGYPDGLDGRGDPARRPHHPRRRRARLDADDADLPRRAAGRRGARRAPRAPPARSSARAASRRSSGSCRSRAWTTRHAPHAVLAPRRSSCTPLARPAFASARSCKRAKLLYSSCERCPASARTARSRASIRTALAAFQAGIRKRYSDEQILAELRACAERLGRSPTMREFAADPETTVHPQTVIEHFGSWNEAKREAGLVPRRFATREELLGLLRELGEELGRTPTARDLDEHRGADAVEVALLAHVRLAHERAPRGGLRRPGGGGAARARDRAGRRRWRGGSAGCRSSPTGPRRGAADATLLTEWQVYRMFDVAPGRVGDVPVPRARAPARGGRRRSRATGRSTSGARRRGERREALRQNAPSCGARTAGRSRSSTKLRSGWKRLVRATARRPRARRSVPSASSRLRSVTPA